MKKFLSRIRRCYKPKLPLLCLGVLLLTLALYVVYAPLHSAHERASVLADKAEFIRYTGRSRPFPNDSDVTVEFMTSRMGSWEKIDEVIRDHEEYACPWKCSFFNSWGRTRDSDADALVFEAFDLENDPEVIPNRSREGQVWILRNPESPWMTGLDMTQYGGVFNWTSFVRLDSDVPLVYGRAVTSHRKQDMTSRENQRPLMHADGKSRPVFWMSSNCVPLNQRDAYVDDLQNFITVDIYSDSSICQPGSYTCRKGAPRCDTLSNNYYFYLAFENANCRDYVTEKFWRSLRTGVVPVVMGDSECYRKLAPPGSYIDVADFRSAEELARHLHQIIKNYTLYQNYFLWRNNYEIRHSWTCDVCKSLRQWDGFRQSYTDLEGWHRQDLCTNWNLIDDIKIHISAYRRVIKRWIKWLTS